MGFAKYFYGKKQNVFRIKLLFLLLALSVLYYLIMASLTIVDILAVMVFTALIYGMTLAPYIHKMFSLFKEKDILERHWLELLVWVILLLWGVRAIFF